MGRSNLFHKRVNYDKQDTSFVPTRQNLLWCSQSLSLSGQPFADECRYRGGCVCLMCPQYITAYQGICQELPLFFFFFFLVTTLQIHTCMYSHAHTHSSCRECCTYRITVVLQPFQELTKRLFWCLCNFAIIKPARGEVFVRDATYWQHMIQLLHCCDCITS